MAEATLPQLANLRDIPGVRQLLMLLAIAAAIAAGVSVFMWSQKPAMVPLYANLAARDASDVATALGSAGIPYVVDPASGAITVAAARVHEARMKLASQGLPKGTGMGFELIQQEQGFGTSQFIETARYQHALETELARTVSSLQPVQSARVHLAMPKQSVFARQDDAASASVLVELAPGRALDSSQVSSIVHLVASSVPELSANNVTVIDQYGHLLNAPGDGSGAAQQAANQFEQTRRVEADYVRRIEQLLTPITGSGRVSAQVVADMDFSRSEEASETYKPDPAAIRSEHTSDDVTHGAADAAQGIPGATSNKPAGAAQAQPLNPPAALAAAGKAAVQPAADAAAQSATPVSESRSSTRNFEMDRTVSHTSRPGGAIKRLSVAVLVDNLPKADGKGGSTLQPLDKAELAKVQSLVEQAVGFDARRGDSISVENVAFISDPVAALTPIPLWQRPEVRDIGRQSLGALVVLILMFAVLRPALKNLISPPPGRKTRATAVLESRQSAAPGEAPESLQQQAAAAAVPHIVHPYEQKLAQARSAVSQDPKRVAQVIKTWVGSDV
ncbi:MAG TPA: flagellar basal-body MS-ring/collar protein FliF [Stenotrophobium sp.]|jgi:flagellar M-ring protein FliF|nr:flagellar basal-body MS-ring/collar protein FliF [Stenotrophobium sp.]